MSNKKNTSNEKILSNLKRERNLLLMEIEKKDQKLDQLLTKLTSLIHADKKELREFIKNCPQTGLSGTKRNNREPKGIKGISPIELVASL